MQYLAGSSHVARDCCLHRRRVLARQWGRGGGVKGVRASDVAVVLHDVRSRALAATPEGSVTTLVCVLCFIVCIDSVLASVVLSARDNISRRGLLID
jgi:hypothetical protein